MMKSVFLKAAVLLVVLSQQVSAQNGKKLLTLEDVTKGYGFYPQSVNGLRSMNDGLYFTTLENDHDR